MGLNDETVQMLIDSIKLLPSALQYYILQYIPMHSLSIQQLLDTKADILSCSQETINCALCRKSQIWLCPVGVSEEEAMPLYYVCYDCIQCKCYCKRYGIFKKCTDINVEETNLYVKIPSRGFHRLFGGIILFYNTASVT